MKVYTDGACSGNPGPGGWAWAVEGGAEGSGGEPHTTNQRMELLAVLEALRALPGQVEVVSDSTYVVNCFNDRWYEGWIGRGWRTAAKKPVANQDLWQPLVELYLGRADEITFSWVKGHSGDPMNDYVDELAVAAAAGFKEGRAASPTISPVAAGESVPASITLEPPVPWPVGGAIWVTGPTDLAAAEAVDEAVRRMDPAEDILISGLRRGAELYAAEAALRHGLQLGVVLPFGDPAANWPDDLRERFDVALSRASWVITLPGDPSKPGTAVRERDEWCRQAVIGVLLVGPKDAADELDAQGLAVVHIENVTSAGR
ncbi:MAG: RNase H family protein [Acidimicrobiales bacterium]